MILGLLQKDDIAPKQVSSHKGGEYHSPCPLCGGTDRFHAWPAQKNGQGSWWCRKCDAGGDCIHYLRHIHGMAYRDACRALNLDPGKAPSRPSFKATPTLPQTRQPQTGLDVRHVDTPGATWQAKAATCIDLCCDALQHNTAAQQHLQQQRGIIPQTAAAFGLGFVQPQRQGQRHRFSRRDKWGLPPKDRNKNPHLLWLPRGLLIPTFEPDHIARLRIRRPQTDLSSGNRYHLVPGSATGPMIIDNSALVTIIVESELDAILLHQEAGHLANIIANGNDSARPTHRAHALLENSKLILAAFDADDAGYAATIRWQEWYGATKVIRCLTPAGKDPAEAWQHGVDLARWIQKHAGIYAQPAPSFRTTKPQPSQHDPQVAFATAQNGQQLAITTSDKRAQIARQYQLPTFIKEELQHIKPLPAPVRRSILTTMAWFPGAKVSEIRFQGGKTHA